MRRVRRELLPWQEITSSSPRGISGASDVVNTVPTSQWNRSSLFTRGAIALLCCMVIVLAALCTLLGLAAAYLYQKLNQEKAEVEEEKEEIDELEDELHAERSVTVYHLAGTMTLLGSIVTMFHMTAHLRHFNTPIVQRKILAILWMSPLYSITSWLSLAFPAAEGYLRIVKDFYEAYLIYQFLSFLIAVLGRGDRGTVVDMLARRADQLRPPVRCLSSCFHPPPTESDHAMANAVLLECQVFALQFVLVRPLTSILMFIFDTLHYGEEGGRKWDVFMRPQFYIVMMQNLSVFTAFTGLLKFYHAVHEDLEWIRPWPKFLCIKGVVFMTFWQGLVIDILARTSSGGQNGSSDGVNDKTNHDGGGDVDADFGVDVDEVYWATWMQNFLICFEMLLFSVAHFCYFPWEEWEEGYREREQHNPRRHEERHRFGDSIALRDFASDVQMVISSHKFSRKEKGEDSPTRSDPGTVSSIKTQPSEDDFIESADGVPSTKGDEGDSEFECVDPPTIERKEPDEEDGDEGDSTVFC